MTDIWCVCLMSDREEKSRRCSLMSRQTRETMLEHNGELATTWKAKADILSHQNEKIFNKEDTNHMPTMGDSPYISMSGIVILVVGVEKLLKNLNPKKAIIPYLLPTRLLKENTGSHTHQNIPTDERQASMTEMRERLGWPTLQQRLCVARITMFHKIGNNNITIDVPDYISKYTWSLRDQYQHYSPEQFSFFPCTIRCWNQLPISLTEVPSQETFQNHTWKAITSWEIEVCHPRELHLRPRLDSCSQQQSVLVFWGETQERWVALYIVCTIVFKQTNACNLDFSCTLRQYTWKGHVAIYM